MHKRRTLHASWWCVMVVRCLWPRSPDSGYGAWSMAGSPQCPRNDASGAGSAIRASLQQTTQGILRYANDTSSSFPMVLVKGVACACKNLVATASTPSINWFKGALILMVYCFIIYPNLPERASTSIIH